MSNCQQTLDCPLLFEKTEQLGEHELRSAIWSDIFSYPGGSHEALHFLFEALENTDTPNYIKEAIKSVFGSATLREEILQDWNLYRGYDHAKRHERQMRKYAPVDLASRCIEDCPSCFKGLLTYNMVEPSFFCHTGHSFFWLAARNEQEELVKHLLLLLSQEDLLRPFSVQNPGEDRYSIFQACTWFKTWFEICLDRLESSPKDALASLGPEQIRKICQYADPGLGNRLLDPIGLDLGKPHPDDAAPGWLSVANRRDPQSMFSWFWERGHQPPEGFLTYVASENCCEAAKWIMDHDEDYHDWWNAALTAAESVDEGSEEMLEVILPSPAEKKHIDRTLAEKIVKKIVHGIYEEVFKLELRGPLLVEKENVAIKKIQTLGKLEVKVDVVSMEIMARIAGLPRLAMELEDISQRV